MIRSPHALALPALLLALPVGCSEEEAPPSPQAAADPAPDGLDRVVSLARACAGGAPHLGLGRDGSPLLLDGHLMISEAEVGLWRVHFTEEEPHSAAYGLPVLVDPVAGTCDGGAVPAPAGETGPSLSELFAAAARCGEALSDDLGVGGSPLIHEDATLGLGSTGRLVFSVPEEQPSTRPSGRDLSLDDTGLGCRLEPMD